MIKIIKGKTAAQLEALQSRIEEKITGKADGVDITYWESLLSQLKGKTFRPSKSHFPVCINENLIHLQHTWLELD